MRTAKTLTVILAALSLVAAFGCQKKKKTTPSGTAEIAGSAEVAKFESGHAAFREAIRYTVLTPDKTKAAEAASKAEAEFKEVARAFPKNPPPQFESDNEWETHIGALVKLMSDIRNQVKAGKTEDAKASILEAQKTFLAIHDKNRINTAGDETVRLLIVCAEMESAFREKRFNDMKHIMPNMRDAQKNFFGSTMPPSARGRENEFDEAKDKVYASVDAFAEAPNPEARGIALENLIKTATEFYVEFGP